MLQRTDIIEEAHTYLLRTILAHGFLMLKESSLDWNMQVSRKDGCQGAHKHVLPVL